MRFTLKRLVFIFGVITAVTAYSYAGNFPFPQNFTYPHGIKATNGSSATLSNLYSSWKSSYITSGGCPSGGLRVLRNTDGNDTVSEGIGYGMIITVYFDDQATFNGLWVYKTHYNDSYGLMNWHEDSSGNISGTYSATDGDEDIAFALIMADKQWGSGGTYNYLALGQAEVAKIKQYEIGSSDYHVKPGDNWDGTYYPSYYTPAWYRVYGDATSDTTFWNNVIAKCAADINANKGVDGLVGETLGSTSYGYNSCRIPWRYAADYIWNGDTNSQTEIGLLASLFGPEGAGGVGDGYNTSNGSISSSNHNGAFIGPAACSLMVSSTYQTVINSFYSYLSTMDITSQYYGGCHQLMSLLMITGNFPNFRNMYTATATPTITLTLTANPLWTKTFTATVTPTFTVTPTAPATNKLNLQVANDNSGNDPCVANSFKYKVKIINNDTVDVALNSLTVRAYFYCANTSDTFGINGCWGGAVYNSAGVSQGSVSCTLVTATAATTYIYSSTRKVNKYVDLTFSGVTVIPANGGYLDLSSGAEIYRNSWATPFDDSCDDFSQLGTNTTYHEDPYFNLFEGANLVCEYTSATTQDALTGINPVTGVSACGGPTTPTNTPVSSFTFTMTRTNTPTFTRTNTQTFTATPSATMTYTATRTSTSSPTLTATPTVTPSVTVTPANSATSTQTRTPTFTGTPSSTITRTATPTGSATGSATPTFTATVTFTPTGTQTATGTFTATQTFTASATKTYTPTGTATATLTWTFSSTTIPTFTKTATDTPSMTQTFTATRTSTAPSTYTSTPTASSTLTISPTWTTGYGTMTDTQTATPSWTESATPTFSETLTLTPTFTITPTPTYSATLTSTGTFTATETPTLTETSTPPDTFTFTATLTYSITDTPTEGDSPTLTVTTTATSTWTQQNTPSYTVTPTLTETTPFTNTATAAQTYTQTGTNTPANTQTSTMTITITPANTASATPPPTKTITPSFTATITLTLTVAATPTNTPQAVATQEIVYPNPYNPSKGDLNIIYKVLDPSDTVKVRFYTRALRLIMEESLYPSGAGMNKGSIQADLFKAFSNGIYFYEVVSRDIKGAEKSGVINKVIILR
jgi:hypothetical protein